MNSPPQSEKYINSVYNLALDDPTNRASTADQSVRLPNPKDVRFRHSLPALIVWSGDEVNRCYTAMPAPLSTAIHRREPQGGPRPSRDLVSLSAPIQYPRQQQSLTPSPALSPSPALTPTLHCASAKPADTRIRIPARALDISGSVGLRRRHAVGMGSAFVQRSALSCARRIWYRT
jgi:hypothetical protein